MPKLLVPDDPPSASSAWALSPIDGENSSYRLSEETLLNPRDGDYDSNNNPNLKDFDSSPISTSRKFGLLPRLRQFLANITLFILPSFISCYFSSKPHKPEKLAPTAWLDGLRGLACVSVVVHHNIYEYTKALEWPYDSLDNTRYIQLPIVRLIHFGPPMVKIFFIISGFVLTVKAVKLTRVPRSASIDGAALFQNLSSSIWKRYLRLYIPCAAGFVICAAMISMGWMESIPYRTRPGWVTGSVERRPPTMNTTIEQFQYAVEDFYSFAVDVTLFNNRSKSYSTDGHLWTIPVEFNCSIQLFLLVAGCCALKRWLRIYIILPIIYTVLLIHGSWGFALFVFGYFLAELHADYLANNTPNLPTNKVTSTLASSSSSVLARLLRICLMIIGLWLISYPRKIPHPDRMEYTTSYQFIIKWTPVAYHLQTAKRLGSTHEFWHSVGAMILVWTIMYSPRVKKFLCHSIIQYFGKISFALYIMHAHVHHSVGYAVVLNGLKRAGIWIFDEKTEKWGLFKIMKGPEGEAIKAAMDGRWNFVIVAGFLCVTFPVTVWWADLFWRGVDAQSVRFLRWVEGKIRR
ncbi:hypothetical protein TWF694_000126 [Orbilia ellipsospora]|uniref:Acyltransferase 3 domain-containing protein n=1 Tax=Orbilia ellipsospora TaxID=2528407 RepID=A0AAV9XUD8_9PEZI